MSGARPQTAVYRRPGIHRTLTHSLAYLPTRMQTTATSSGGAYLGFCNDAASPYKTTVDNTYVFYSGFGTSNGNNANPTMSGVATAGSTVCTVCPAGYACPQVREASRAHWVVTSLPHV